MPESGSTPDLIRLAAQLLAGCDPGNLDTDTVRALSEVLTIASFPAGATVAQQDDVDGAAWGLLSGRATMMADSPEGMDSWRDEVLPGEWVGGAIAAVGEPRGAIAVAAEPVTAARLSPDGLERLKAEQPKLAHMLGSSQRPRRLRRQIRHTLEQLFGVLPSDVVQLVESEITWRRLEPSEVLMRQGDAGDCMHLVASGRLRAEVSDSSGVVRTVRELGAGKPVGELGLLTGQPRSASVTAVRQSQVLTIDRPLFEKLIARYPQAVLNLAAVMAERQRSQGADVAQVRAPYDAALTIVVAPITHHADGKAVARMLQARVEQYGPVLYVDAATFGARFGAPSHGPSSEQDAEFAAWLSEQENRYVTIILEAEAQLTEWTRRAIGQADRVLLVAWSGDNPEVCTLEREVQDRGLLAHQDLVLLHPVETVQPVGTDAWLAGRRLSGHHHLRLGNAVDEGRLARRVTGNGNGLVLGGGGARGLAHVGVIHAIEEAEIPVDMVGGTSIGALVGAAYALKGSYADMLPLADAFASPSRIFDRTLPLTSLMKGAKILDLLRELYGDVCIEDLWGPYFAVSTNLSRARMEVHTTGPLWLAVRKSMSIPAIFPPMQQDGDVIVDGGVVNNFPVDVMREYSDFGTVIGVNVAPATDKVKSYNFGDSVSGWRILWSRVNPMARKIKAPALIGSILRTQEINSVMRLRDSLHNVDLLIEPPVDGFRLNEYEAHRQLDQVGYEAARQAISLWRSESQAEAVQKG